MVGFDLPEEWCLTKVGDVCSKITDGSHNPPRASTEGLPMLSAKNIHNGIVDFNLEYRLIPHDDFFIEDKRTNIQADDVLLTIVGALGRTALVVKDYTKFTLQRSVAVLAAPHLDAKCFRYSLEEYQFQKQITDNAKGTAQKGIYLKKLSELTLPIPPLAEQKEIADRLDKLLAQVEATQARLARIPDIVKRFRQSVLAAAVSGKLTEEWRELNKGVDQWRQLELKEAAEIIDPHPSHRTPKVVDGGVPYIGIGDLRLDGSIDFENARKVSFDVLKEHNERYTLKTGDFIFGKIGTLGKATILPIGIDYTLSANVILIQPIEHIATPAYLQFFLSSPSTLNEIAKQANSTSQAAFGIKKMRTFQCKLPNKEEQNEIVRRVEQLFAYADTLEQQAKAAKERVDKLTQAILAKAFSGELTADWRAANPDLISGDNSAAALLARIQAERAAIKPRKRASKPAINPTSSGVTQ